MGCEVEFMGVFFEVCYWVGVWCICLVCLLGCDWCGEIGMEMVG